MTKCQVEASLWPHKRGVQTASIDFMGIENCVFTCSDWALLSGAIRSSPNRFFCVLVHDDGQKIVEESALFAEMTSEFPQVCFVSFSCSFLPAPLQDLITVLPSVVIFRREAIVATFASDSLMLETHSFLSAHESAVSSGIDMKDEFKYNANCVLMYGSSTFPRDAASETFCSQLRSIGIKFNEIDVFGVESSSLPAATNTFPQLFCSGTFVCDAASISSLSNEQLLASTTYNLDERCHALINCAKTVLFLKGDAAAQKCGFSRQIVAILAAHRIEFECFDILRDEEVRQHIKVYSQWPTFPQLYVNGELVGGLDIVKELVSSGQFLSLFE